MRCWRRLVAEPEDLDWEGAPGGPATAPAALVVALDSWAGPLDLLLALARVQKVDLRQISILALVEQYLAYIAGARALKLEVAADYLVMAAWLAYLKSALLLPKNPAEEPSAEELALRLQLRLARLGAMREAAARLLARDLVGRDVFRRAAPEGLAAEKLRRWDAGLFDLMAAYGQVQARRTPVVHRIADRAVVTLEAALAQLEAALAVRLDWGELAAMLPPDLAGPLRRSALASAFVAALELARQGRVELRQDAAFAPLLLKRAAA